MATRSTFRINQPPGSPSTYDRSRRDIDLYSVASERVELEAEQKTETSYLWEVVTLPDGATVSITGGTAHTCNFEINDTGSYLVKLTVNAADPGTISRTTLLFGVPLPGSGLCLPAMNETNQDNSQSPYTGFRGSEDKFNAMFHWLDTHAGKPVEYVSSNKSLVSGDSGKKFITDAAGVTFSLPSAAIGLEYHFGTGSDSCVVDADGAETINGDFSEFWGASGWGGVTVSGDGASFTVKSVSNGSGGFTWHARVKGGNISDFADSTHTWYGGIPDYARELHAHSGSDIGQSVQSFTGNLSITGYDGYICDNFGATDTVILTIPDPTSGVPELWSFMVRNYDTPVRTLRVNSTAAAGQKLVLSNGVEVNWLEASSLGATLKIWKSATTSGGWLVIGGSGDWTDNNGLVHSPDPGFKVEERATGRQINAGDNNTRFEVTAGGVTMTAPASVLPVGFKFRVKIKGGAACSITFADSTPCVFLPCTTGGSTGVSSSEEGAEIEFMQVAAGKWYAIHGEGQWTLTAGNSYRFNGWLQRSALGSWLEPYDSAGAAYGYLSNMTAGTSRNGYWVKSAGDGDTAGNDIGFLYEFSDGEVARTYAESDSTLHTSLVLEAYTALNKLRLYGTSAGIENASSTTFFDLAHQSATGAALRFIAEIGVAPVLSIMEFVLSTGLLNIENFTGDTVLKSGATKDVSLASRGGSATFNDASNVSMTGSIAGFSIVGALNAINTLASSHTARHTDGSDDIQSATNAQKGLATAAHITSLEGAVQKSLFDAQTVLAATADNTPAALTVAEQTVVGRITAGNVAALTSSQLRTLISAVTASQTKKVFIRIDDAEDGSSGPAVSSLVSSGNGKINTRDFSSSEEEDVVIPWEVPSNINAASGIKFEVCGIITSATAPASGEGVVFKMSGYSIGVGDSLSGTFGTEVLSSDTDLNASGADTQYDRFKTTQSGSVTVTDLAAGELAMLHLERDPAETDDDYEQDIGVYGIVIEYTETLGTD